jgi:hypothetical protein
VRGRGSLLKMSDRAIKALQKIDRGKGHPVRLGYNAPEINELVTEWHRGDGTYYTLNRRGADTLRFLRKPRPPYEPIDL